QPTRSEAPNYKLRRPQNLLSEALRRAGKRKHLVLGNGAEERVENLSSTPTQTIEALSKRHLGGKNYVQDAKWVGMTPCTPQKRKKTSEPEGEGSGTKDKPM
ncbi:unnamed protein product, partial [Discosporangium mesarthrocarpum]